MSGRPAVRPSTPCALAAAAAVAALFVAAARWIGQAPAPAIWGGAVWVFLLATIVALPLAAAGRSHVAAGPWRRGGDASSMVLAVAVWVCTLPLVFLLVTPLLGLRAAALTAAVLLGVMAVVCWAVCVTSASAERRAAGERQP